MVTELLIRGRKLNIFLVFITQSYFVAAKNIRLNSRQYFVPNKRELQQIALNHSSDIDFEDFMNLYTTLASDSSLRFRENLLERI